METLEQFAAAHTAYIIRVGGLFKLEQVTTARGRTYMQPVAGSGGTPCVGGPGAGRLWFTGQSPLAVHPCTGPVR